MNDIFNDDIFNSLFNDTAGPDVNEMFDKAEKKPAEEKTEEPVKEKAPAVEEKTAETAEEAPAAEKKAEKPVQKEEPVEATAEAVEEAPKAEEPVAEEPAKEEAPAEEPKAEAVEEVKEEVEQADAAEESGDAETDANAEADAASEKAVEADAPATEEAKAAEPAEPVVEVKAEKKHRRRRTKKAKVEEKAEEKKDEVVAAAEEEPASSEINEDFINQLILVIGPNYKSFRDSVNDRINKIQIKPNMASAVIDSMISQNNELERMLMIEGQGYYDAYTSLTDKETGLIAETRAAAEAKADGTVAERRYAGQVALEHYKFPATGEKVNLLRYANALKQITSFLDNAKSYVKSTGIALNTMRKVA